MIALTAAAFAEARVVCAVVDVRDQAAFAAGHLPGSGGIPVAELEERRAELPARDAAVLVVAADGDGALAGATELEHMGYADVRWLDAPLGAIGDGPSERGLGARLWRPAAFLEEVLPHLPRGRAIDIAAGSGREAAVLAMAGFEVEAWDRAPEALDRARALASRHGAQLTTVVYDFELAGATIPAESYDVVICFRFLQRSLLPEMEKALRPGGHLVYETYRVGQERFGRPTHRRFLLRPGEFLTAFPGLEVLRHEELDPPGGPVTSRLWARRP